MSTNLIIKEEDQKTDMDIEDYTDEEKKNNHEICMSGIELPSIADENRFQRRHFSNKMSSNIFFSEMPREDNVSSGNASVDKKELFPPAGHDTPHGDQKQLERRHFHSPSEDYVQSEGKENQDQQTYSSGAVELTDVPDQKQTERHYVHKKTSSDIFFCNLPTESNVLSRSASVDREELLFTSARHDTRYADQKQLGRRHFHSFSEDYIQPERSTNQDKHADLSGTVELTKVETNDVKQNKTQRQHFHERTSSDIFFHLPTEDNVSSGSASVNKEELLFPLAGRDTHCVDQKQGERRHFHSLEDCMLPENNTNGDEQVDSSGVTELPEVEIHGSIDKNQTQRQHFHEKTSSDIFFRHLPTEDDVSSGSVNVDREELLFPSAGHDTRYADQKQGERRHFHSSSDDYMQPKANCDEVCSSVTAESG